ncbi:hypothetical protein FQN57_006890 [Myotisia sp. PD_48]|nr:hypothetical protein FQN57_006890 [Myotisia sp. PD_48]
MEEIMNSSPPALHIAKRPRVEPELVLAACRTCRSGHRRCDRVRPDQECIYPEHPPSSMPKPQSRRASDSGKSSLPRAKVACTNCRKAKRRCDGQQPSCAQCMHRNLNCEISIPGQSSQIFYRPSPESASHQPISRARARSDSPIVDPNDTTIGLNRERPSAASASSVEIIENGANQTYRTPTSSEPPHSVRRDRPSPNSPILSRSRQATSHHQDMRMSESIISVECSPQEAIEVKELDTNILLLQLREAISQRTDMSKPGPTVQADEELKRLSQIGKSGVIQRSPDPAYLTLPSRHTADHLLATYLTREYVNLPIFHLPNLQAEYVELWKSEPTSDDTEIFRGILNGIFALACLTTSPTDRRDARLYYARAQQLIQLDGLETGTLATVQAHIIASQYLIAINLPKAAWKSIKIALGVAQSLRLHLSSGSHHSRNRSDKELAKKIWHSCILLERSIALNLGSNMLVTPRLFQVPLPIPLENEYIDIIFGGEPVFSAERPSIIEFFAASCRLFERYEDIVDIQESLRKTRGHPRKVLETFDCQKLLDADRLLCNWVSSLPPYLQPGSDHASLTNPIAQRQHNLLRIRYLTVRLLLWRPLLGLLAAAPDILSKPIQRDIYPVFESPLLYTITRHGALSCIRSAQEITHILTSNRHFNVRLDCLGPVPAWWENIGTIFTCALVILAARICPKRVLNELPGGAKGLEETWLGCTDLLSEYSGISSRAKTHWSVLESLVAVVAGIAESGIDEYAPDDLEEASMGKFHDVSWLEALPIDLPL